MAVKPPDIPLPSELEPLDSPTWDALQLLTVIRRRIWEW